MGLHHDRQLYAGMAAFSLLTTVVGPGLFTQEALAAEHTVTELGALERLGTQAAHVAEDEARVGEAVTGEAQAVEGVARDASEVGAAGSNLSAAGDVASNAQGGSQATETFYRGMSRASYERLKAAGQLSVLRGEKFVTQDIGYIQQLAARHPDWYQTIVRFDMEPGTRDALIAAGARSNGRLLEDAGLGYLPRIQRGMTDMVYIKAEGTAINFGPRPGSVGIFNSRIIHFEELLFEELLFEELPFEELP